MPERCRVCRSRSMKFTITIWIGKPVCDRCLDRYSTSELKEKLGLPDDNKCSDCGAICLIHQGTRELYNPDGSKHSCKEPQSEEDELLELFGGK